jgi:hypothetical protein
MPLQERFRHAQLGRASNSVLQMKLPVSYWTAAEAANCFYFCFTYIVNFSADVPTFAPFRKFNKNYFPFSAKE